VQVFANTPIKFRWLTFLCFKKIQIGIGKPSGYRVAYLQLREPVHLEQNGGYLNDAGMSEAIRGRSALPALEKHAQGWAHIYLPNASSISSDGALPGVGIVGNITGRGNILSIRA